MAGKARDDLVLMGFVGKPHGVRGDVKIVPETDDPARFKDFNKVVLEIDGAHRACDVLNVRLQTSSRGIIPVLTLEGIDDREQANSIRGSGIYVEEDRLDLEEDEFFLHDLVGLRAQDEDGVSIGLVDEVLVLPAGPVLVIARNQADDVLIPAIGEFIADITEDAVVIKVIEGLLDM